GVAVGPVLVLPEEALPLLAPVVGVAAVVVVPCGRDGDVEEVRVAQDRARGSEPAAGVSVDPDASEVDPGAPLGELSHACDLAFEPVVAHVAVVCGVELPGPHRHPERVNLYDDEPEFGECACIAARGGEAASPDAPGLRARVD